MLLIGSRAIVHYLPEFRPPRDWDLVGSDEEIARLARVLARSDRHPSRPEKSYFQHQGALVEVASTDAVPYWAKVAAAYSEGPVIHERVLGELRLPDPGFLLVSKQCGLIYGIHHWHKNLEDLYFMRDRITSIPEHVAALLPDAIADSKRMFGERHAAAASVADPCHPGLAGPRDPKLHAALHEQLALGSLAAVLDPRAWEGFPELRGEPRRERIIDLFAEETMVLAAEHARERALTGEQLGETQVARWALRILITGKLPEGLRYFGVNHYREIMGRIPDGWLSQALG